MARLAGQSSLIGFAFTVLLAVVVITSISLLFFSFYNDVREQEVRQGLNQIALSAGNQIVKMYEISGSSGAEPANSSSILINSVDLGLPAQAGGSNYEISLVTANDLTIILTTSQIEGLNATQARQSAGSKIVARSTSDPIMEVERDLPELGIVVQGTAQGGQNTTLRYYRINSNNTVYDTVILGDSSLFIPSVTVT